MYGLSFLSFFVSFLDIWLKSAEPLNGKQLSVIFVVSMSKINKLMKKLDLKVICTFERRSSSFWEILIFSVQQIVFFLSFFFVSYEFNMSFLTLKIKTKATTAAAAQKQQSRTAKTASESESEECGCIEQLSSVKAVT